MPKIDVCPLCSRIGDSTSKTLYLCPFCKMRVCGDHIAAKLAYIPDLTRTDKLYKETMKAVEEDNVKTKVGHRCFQYTKDFWDRFEREKILRVERERNVLDGFGYLTNYERDLLIERNKCKLQETLEELNKHSITSEPKKKHSVWQKMKGVFSS